MSFKSIVPWSFRLAGKVLLSRMPMSYGLWRKIGLFKHGSMHNIDYARSVFERHIKSYLLLHPESRFTVLELGPGDSIFSALFAWSAGARKIYLVDDGDYIVRDTQLILKVANELKKSGLTLPDFKEDDNFGKILQRLNAEYLTNGVGSLSTISENSIDFIWSQAVLEHIRRADVGILMNEFSRILTNTGLQSHRIDLKDHLGGSLNNLRFSTKVWESSWMSNSGFYTNRYRYKEWLVIFEKAGFMMEQVHCDNWDSLPLAQAKMDKHYSSMSVEQLLVSGCDVIMKKNVF